MNNKLLICLIAGALATRLLLRHRRSLAVAEAAVAAAWWRWRAWRRHGRWHGRGMHGGGIGGGMHVAAWAAACTSAAWAAARV